MIGIYKWTNKINGKSYIGQSVNIENRRQRHIADSYYTKSNTYNTAFHSAIRKYGEDNFTFEVICICSKDELNALEKFYIQKFNSTIPNGYNMTDGGENPWYYNSKFSKENILDIIFELRTTDNKTEEIATKWGCSSSLIKKICSGDEYYIEGEKYPIRDKEHIQRIMNKYNSCVNGRNPSVKLSSDIVENIIYDLMTTEVSIKELAVKYNISTDQISRINNGKIWLQVNRPIPCRNTKKQNENKALLVAELLLHTTMSQSEILKTTGYKDRHTIQKINSHLIYKDLLVNYPNPIRTSSL